MAGVSLDEIEGKIKSAVSRALHGPIAKDLVEDITIHADTDVYDAYSPRRYVRRYTLTDESSYPIADEGEMQISITAKAPFNRLYGGLNFGDDLPGLMNYGAGWNGHYFDYGTPNPRPYFHNAVDEWNADWGGSKFKEEVRKALVASGFTVKG